MAATKDEKAALRREMTARRDSIAPAARASAAQGVASVGLPPDIFAAAGGGHKVISSYWSIGAELDPGQLERRLIADGHRICLPCIQGKADPMLFRLWTHGDPMRERKWGIKEPVEPAAAVDPDILLVPLLAWDARGFRLGYGGGYYDRSIQALRTRKSVVVVGFAYDEQRVDAVPHLDYDERLDWMLTPSGAIRFA